MRRHVVILAAAVAATMGGALLVTSSVAVAASESERICDGLGGDWDKATKTCVLPPVETKPGKNQGNATWETQQTDTAHGTLKNAKSTSESSCEGPGNSTSKC